MISSNICRFWSTQYLFLSSVRERDVVSFFYTCLSSFPHVHLLKSSLFSIACFWNLCIWKTLGILYVCFSLTHHFLFLFHFVCVCFCASMLLDYFLIILFSWIFYVFTFQRLSPFPPFPYPFPCFCENVSIPNHPLLPWHSPKLGTCAFTGPSTFLPLMFTDHTKPKKKEDENVLD